MYYSEISTDIEYSNIKNTLIEKYVIGILLNGYKTPEILTEDCFYDDKYKIIFNAIKELQDKNKIVDLVTVCEKLKSKGIIGKTMSNYDVASLSSVEVFLMESKLLPYSRILKEYELKRRLFKISSEVINESSGGYIDVFNTIQKIKTEISNLQIDNNDGISPIADGLKLVLNNTILNKTDKKDKGLYTGFNYFDNRTGGFHKSDLVIIAGETSMGKSSLALCIAKNISQNGTPIAFYSLEMSTLQLSARLVSIASGVSSSEILYSHLDDSKFNSINYGVGNVEGLPIFIDDNGQTNIDGIMSSIRFMSAKIGIKVAFIDYLQLVETKGKFGTKEQEVSFVIQKLKNLAKELDICIVVLSQLSREKQNPYPTLSRLRDSGQIEQAADVVMFVYRPEYYGADKKFPEPFKEKETKGMALIDIAKGRNIGIFKFLCAFNAYTTHFKDMNVNEIPTKTAELITEEEPF